MALTLSTSQLQLTPDNTSIFRKADLMPAPALTLAVPSNYTLTNKKQVNAKTLLSRVRIITG